jgi:hypothetical protein
MTQRASYTDRFRLAATGEWAPGTSAAAGPAVACRAVLLKARAANTGKVYIGLANTVTAANGANDATTGYELAAGEELGLLIGITSLSDLWAIGDGASDSLVYLALDAA